ncbi:hypothetical protein RSAG8_03337, partial [Rhizoctonia solani AG-8 WAC10335]
MYPASISIRFDSVMNRNGRERIRLRRAGVFMLMLAPEFIRITCADH